MKYTMIACLLATLAGGAQADAIETDRKHSVEGRDEISRDLSQKATAKVGLGVLLRQGLAEVRPLDSSYSRNVFRKGRLTISDVVDDHVAGDLPGFQAKRAAQLRAAGYPAAKAAAEILEACQDSACIYDYGWREVLGMAVQQAGAPQRQGFVEGETQGRRTIYDSDFPTWISGVVLHYKLADAVESYLGRTLPTDPLPHAERRVALVQAFFAIPRDVLLVTTGAYSMQTVHAQSGSPVELQDHESGRYYKMDDGGIHVKLAGAEMYGSGYAGGVQYEFSSDDSGSIKRTDSRSNSKSTTGKEIRAQKTPGDAPAPKTKAFARRN